MIFYLPNTIWRLYSLFKVSPKTLYKISIPQYSSTQPSYHFIYLSRIPPLIPTIQPEFISVIIIFHTYFLHPLWLANFTFAPPSPRLHTFHLISYFFHFLVCNYRCTIQNFIVCFFFTLSLVPKRRCVYSSVLF